MKVRTQSQHLVAHRAGQELPHGNGLASQRIERCGTRRGGHVEARQQVLQAAGHSHLQIHTQTISVPLPPSLPPSTLPRSLYRKGLR